MLLAVALPALALAADPRCAICGKPITSAYLQVEGSTVHPECFRCIHCGKPIQGEFVMRGERRYHPECALELLDKCGVCGRPLAGEFYKKDDASYCLPCYTDKIADRCVLCGEPILDQTYPGNGWGDFWHAQCADRLVRCASCDRAIAPRDVPRASLDDGRRVCPVCRREGIVGASEARAAVERVASEIRRDGFAVDASDVAVSLCDRKELARLTGSQTTSGHTTFQTTLTNGAVTGERISIQILTHLRGDRFDAVAAHELTHVFLHREVKGELPAWLEEGLCNYAASLLLKRRSGTLAEVTLSAMEEDPDPDYGEGYRRVRKWIEGRSLSGLLYELRMTGAAPRGM